MMFPIGLSTCGAAIDESLFANYARAGISKMEISSKKEDYDLLDYSSAKALSARYGVEIWSFHLPFMPFSEIDLSALDETMRRNTVSLCAELIRRASEIGIRRFIAHASGEPIRDCDRAARMAQAKKSLRELAGIAAERGAMICVEDLPRTCLGRTSAEILELLTADDRLRVCCDTNHLLSENLIDFIHCTFRIMTGSTKNIGFRAKGSSIGKRYLPRFGRSAIGVRGSTKWGLPRRKRLPANAT